MNKNNISYVIFRLNAGSLYGLGHLSRNLVLAKSFPENITPIFFILTDNKEMVRSFINSKFAHNIEKYLFNLDKVSDLDCQIKENINTKNTLTIIDCYTHKNKLSEYLIANKLPFLEYSYEPDKFFEAKYVLNPNIFSNTNSYKKLVNYDCTELLIGKNYIILDKEIVQAKDKTDLNSENIILIAIGGGIWPDWVEKFIMKIIINNPELKFALVSTYYNEQILGVYDNLIYVAENDLMSYYTKSMFSIVSGGVTVNEMIYLNKYIISLPFSANHHYSTRAISNLEASIVIENEKYEDLNKEPTLFKDVIKSLIIKNNINNEIDGKGVERILKKIL